MRAWSDAENKYARKYLDGLPLRAALVDQLKRLVDHPTLRYSGLTVRQGVVFALKAQPPAEQPMLMTLKSADQPDSERIVVDPNKLNPTGGTSMDFYVPSTDAKYVAVSLAKGRSRKVEMCMFTKWRREKETGAPIPRVNGGTAGGSVAECRLHGFYYPLSESRRASTGGFGLLSTDQYFHRLGADPKQDQYSIGKEFPRIAEIQLLASGDGRHILASMANGDGRRVRALSAGPFRTVAPDRRGSLTKSAPRNSPQTEICICCRTSPRPGKDFESLARKPLVSDAQIVVRSRNTIAGFVPAANVLYIEDQTGSPSQIRVFDKAGKPMGTVPILPLSSIYQMTRSNGDELLYQNASFLEPPAWFRYDPATKPLTRTA